MPDWTELFDPFGVEHVLELLRDDVKAQRFNGYRPSLHIPLRSILQKQIAEYLAENGGVNSGALVDRADVEAAMDLYRFADELAERVQKKKIKADDPENLERLWLLFIANGAGPRIYDDIPKAKAATSKGGKNSGVTRGGQRKQNLDAAAAALNRLRAHDTLGFQSYSAKKVATEAQLKQGTVEHLTMALVRRRADELRKTPVKK